jgi:hypothetical protein
VAKAMICEQIATRYRWGLNLDFMNNRACNNKVFRLWSYNKNVYMLSCEKEIKYAK